MNMPILRHYFSDDLLRDINNAIHLNSTVRAELPPLFIERFDFLDHVEKRGKNLHLISIKPSTLQLMTRNYMPH